MIGETPADAAHPEDADKRIPEGAAVPTQDAPPEEIGGRDGPEPTRYGDWEKNGRCIDF